MSAPTELEHELHVLLHAQADAVDVSRPRPDLAPIADVIDIDEARSSRRRTAIISVAALATAAALIAGFLATRTDTTRQRVELTTTTGIPVEYSGPPLVAYKLAHLPAGYSEQPASKMPTTSASACTKWTVVAATVHCNEIVGTTGTLYDNSDPKHGTRATGTLTVFSGRLDAVPSLLAQFDRGEHVQVRGHDARYASTEYDTRLAGGTAVRMTMATLEWRERDGITIVISHAGSQPDALSRDTLTALANDIVATGSVEPKIGLVADTVKVRGPKGSIDYPLAVSGPSDAPCAGFGPCVPFTPVPGSHRLATEVTGLEDAHAVAGTVTPDVATVRVAHSGGAATTATPNRLPGYRDGFFVVSVPKRGGATTYTLLDATGHVIERGTLPVADTP